MSVNKIEIDGSLTPVADLVQKSELPAASASYLGKVFQYTGETTANYINGYFYKCISDGADPAVYSWVNIDVQDITVIKYVDGLPTSGIEDIVYGVEGDYVSENVFPFTSEIVTIEDESIPYPVQDTFDTDQLDGLFYVRDESGTDTYTPYLQGTTGADAEHPNSVLVKIAPSGDWETFTSINSTTLTTVESGDITLTSGSYVQFKWVQRYVDVEGLRNDVNLKRETGKLDTNLYGLLYSPISTMGVAPANVSQIDELVGFMLYTGWAAVFITRLPGQGNYVEYSEQTSIALYIKSLKYYAGNSEKQTVTPLTEDIEQIDAVQWVTTLPTDPDIKNVIYGVETEAEITYKNEAQIKNDACEESDYSAGNPMAEVTPAKFNEKGSFTIIGKATEQTGGTYGLKYEYLGYDGVSIGEVTIDATAAGELVQLTIDDTNVPDGWFTDDNPSYIRFFEAETDGFVPAVVWTDIATALSQTADTRITESSTGVYTPTEEVYVKGSGIAAYEKLVSINTNTYTITTEDSTYVLQEYYAATDILTIATKEEIAGETKFYAGNETEQTLTILSAGEGGSYTAGYGITISSTNEISTSTFVGTQEEWNALSATEKAKFDEVCITNEGVPENTYTGHLIDDENGDGMPQRNELQFTGGVAVTDDSENDKTVVDVKTYTGGRGIEIDAGTYEVAAKEEVKLIYDGTKQEFDQFTAEEKAAYDLAVFSDDDTELVDVYSTDEVRTNKVWIDGKPIYRKVLIAIRNGAWTSNWTLTTDKRYNNPTDIPNNIETLVNARAQSLRDNGWYDSITQVQDIGLSININTQSMWANWPEVVTKADVIIEYTKTIDG